MNPNRLEINFEVQIDISNSSISIALGRKSLK